CAVQLVALQLARTIRAADDAAAEVGWPVAPAAPAGPGGPGSPLSPRGPAGPGGPGSPFSPGGPAAPGSPFGPSGPDTQMENAIATAIPLMFITHPCIFQRASSLGTSRNVRYKHAQQIDVLPHR